MTDQTVALSEALGDLQRLLDYADDSDGSQYGTLSTSLVRNLTKNALAALSTPPAPAEPIASVRVYNGAVSMSANEIQLAKLRTMDGASLYAAPPPQQPAQGWQQIETAPKDGTEVLIWLGAPWSKAEKARWYAPWTNWQCGTIPSDPVREEYHGIGQAIPTHWMPLPAAPAMTAAQDAVRGGGDA